MITDPRKEGTNLLLDAHAEPFAEDDRIGCTLRLGSADAAPDSAEDDGPLIEACAPTICCVMVERRFIYMI